jgi:hypothetical protein
MSDAAYYVAEGNLGKTYAIVHNGEAIGLIEYPDGSVGQPFAFDELRNWSFERWRGQMGATEINK